MRTSCVYLVRPNLDDAALLLDVPQQDNESFPIFENENIGERWREWEVYFDDSPSRSTNFRHIFMPTDSSVAFARHLVETLSPCLDGLGELLPVRGPGDQSDVVVLNPTRSYPLAFCTDRTRSEQVAATEKATTTYREAVARAAELGGLTFDELYDELDPLVYLPDFLPAFVEREPLLFAIDELGPKLFSLETPDVGRRNFSERVRDAGLTGLDFLPVWSSELGGADVSLLRL